MHRSRDSGGYIIGQTKPFPLELKELVGGGVGDMRAGAGCWAIAPGVCSATGAVFAVWAGAWAVRLSIFLTNEANSA